VKKKLDRPAVLKDWAAWYNADEKCWPHARRVARFQGLRRFPIKQ
jgi:hypothetical protein